MFTLLSALNLIDPERLYYVLTILGILGTIMLWALSTVYVKKKDFNKQCEKEKAESDSMWKFHLDDSKEWRTAMTNAVADLKKNQEIFAAGPYTEMVHVISDMKDTLVKIADKQSVEHEKTMDTLLGIDRRLVVVETRQKGVLETLPAHGHMLGLSKDSS
jgi:hypothetical protein